MSQHRLDPLLQPSSLAVLGASERPGSVGRMMIEQLLLGGYKGALTAINANYESVLGVPCFPHQDALPETPEHLVFCIPNQAIETELETAIRLGVKAATVVASLETPDGTLKTRVQAMAREAGLLICGANGNGFYNFDRGLWVCGFRTRPDHRPGGICLVTHSGSVFGALLDCEARLDYNLAISSGQELTVSLADYMDFALAQPTTRVIALFMETVRDPEAFVAALAEANAKSVPVIALKVGRSRTAARMAASHSGALVGDDRVFEALFERYGVLRVETIDELAATLMLFAQPRPVGPGGLVTIHDSGGERELLVDLAEQEGVPLAVLSEHTKEELRPHLDPGLEAENPLDAWGSGRDYEASYGACLDLMMRDPDAALGAIICDRGPGGRIFPEYPRIAAAARLASGRPVAIVSNHQGSGACEATLSATQAGTPVIDGLRPFLRASRCLLKYRDFRDRPEPQPRAPDPDALRRWRARLGTGPVPGEHEALRMLDDFGIPANSSHPVRTPADLDSAAARFGFPLVLKTARADIAHKSDACGVRLDIRDRAQLAAAYQSLTATLGPEALVAPQVSDGFELILGMSRDATFGPVVLVGAGGVLAEVLEDVAVAIPPFDPETAGRLIDRLACRRLLAGYRGTPAADRTALCEAVAAFSVMAAHLGDLVSQIDVNPLRARPDGVLALDALVVSAPGSA